MTPSILQPDSSNLGQIGLVSHYGIRSCSGAHRARRGTRTASRTTGNIGESQPCPRPRIIASGCPSPLRARWIVVPSHPWERPMASSGGSTSVLCSLAVPLVMRERFVPCWCARLMVDSTETVQSIIPSCVYFGQKPRVEPIPCPVGGETPGPLLYRLPRTELPRQVPLGDPAPVSVIAYSKPGGGFSAGATMPAQIQEQRLDPGPLTITHNICS